MEVLILLILGSVLFKGLECNETRSVRSLLDCPLATGDCSPSLIGYQIYDREHREYGQYIEVAGSWENLTNAGYTPGTPVAVVIPGYGESIRRFEIESIKNELLENGDMLVILMDWSKLVPEGCYITSVMNVRFAGSCLADLVTALGRPHSGLHVIGFSLGAHVPGAAADFLAPYKIPRITGLDPAFPLFWGFLSHKRLSKDDGQFVDIIHTNAFLKGHMLPLGHVDFFINGGIIQTGCNGSLIDVIDCSHVRAPLYYAETINTKVGFFGCKTSYLSIFFETCQPEDVNQLMGYHVNPKLEDDAVASKGIAEDNAYAANDDGVHHKTAWNRYLNNCKSATIRSGKTNSRMNKIMQPTEDVQVLECHCSVMKFRSTKFCNIH